MAKVNLPQIKVFNNTIKTKYKMVSYKTAAPLRETSNAYLKDRNFAIEWWNIMQKLKTPIDEVVEGALYVIENFAKSKNVFVDLTRRTNIIKGKVPKLKDSIQVKVTNPKNNQIRVGFVPLNNQSNIHAVKSMKIFNVISDELEVVRPVKSEYEDNFLRQIYRTIESLVKESNK